MPNVERLKELIEQARKAHDEPTVKALGEKLHELTGIYEPEFAPVESSGDPKLDHLRKVLILAIAARDEATVATLREKIKEIEGEPLPEVNIELAEEELVDGDPIPCSQADTAITLLEPLEKPEDEIISLEELEESLEPDEEDILIEELMKGKLMATQIAALQKVGIATEEDAIEYIYNDGTDAFTALVGIKGISDKSANIILDTLCYEA